MCSIDIATRAASSCWSVSPKSRRTAGVPAHRCRMQHEVRAPGPGWAYVTQGNHVLHAAHASENWTRIVSVISLCRKDTLAVESGSPFGT